MLHLKLSRNLKLFLKAWGRQ